jgi:hypothetical protein
MATGSLVRMASGSQSSIQARKILALGFTLRAVTSTLKFSSSKSNLKRENKE